MSRLVRRMFARFLAPPRPARSLRRAADLRTRLMVQPLEGRVVPATFTVTTTGTSGAGSLRQAIIDANNASGADTIIFGPLFATAQSISLQSALPSIFDDLTISGPGANLLTVQRDPALPATIPFRVFGIAAGASLSGLTISGGLTTVVSRPGRGGAGVFVNTALPVSILNSVITGNTASGPGGGIYVFDGGALTVRNSTVSGNTAGTNATPTYPPAGGGIYFHNGGSLLLENSTVSGNVAAPSPFTPMQGGGLYLYGSNAFAGNFVIRNSTISGNSAGTTGGGIVFSTTGNNPNHSLLIQNSTITGNSAGTNGGGVLKLGPVGTVTIESSVIANNSAPGGPDVNGVVTPRFSLIRDQSGTTIVNGSNNLPAGTDPMLDPTGLANNGGPTRTIALQPSSPLINAGSNPASLGTDQRGMPRSFGQPDIGAVEIQPAGTPGASGSFANVTTSGGTEYTFQVTYTDDTAINVGTLDSSDIRVTGPSFSTLATFVSVDANTNGTPRVATYRITPPGNSWDFADNGTYTVAVEPNQVADTGGNFVPAGPVGTFQVSLPRELVVTNTNDAGAGSLRQAILDANFSTGTPDVVTFDSSFATARTITLTSGELLVTDSVTLTGPGVNLLTVRRDTNAPTNFRIFNVNGPAVIDVTLSGLTITGGNTSGTGGAGAAGDGAGVLVSNENLTLNNVAITGNRSATEGGGIGVVLAASLTIRNSTISGNTSNGTVGLGGYGGAGGGIYFAYNGSLLLENSTISGNSSNSRGGGLYFFGAVTVGGLTVRNSTITGNTAALEGGGVGLSGALGTLLVQNSTITGNAALGGAAVTLGGGGIVQSNGNAAIITVVSSIVSGNTANIGPDISNGGVTNVNFSAVGSPNNFTPSATSGNNLPFGASLNLQPLANNGGPTQTIALGAGSLAIDAGSNPANLATDQRGTGFLRVAGTAADIGAFETQAGSPTGPPRIIGAPVVNSGAAQRSMVTSITVTFSTIVSLPANIASAFTLSRIGGGAVTIGTATAQTVSGATVVTLSGFSGTEALFGGSLNDGRYTLTALASQITANGQQLDGNGDGTGGDNFVFGDSGAATGNQLYRFFGDVTGDRFVNGADFATFRTAFGTQSPDPNYVAAFDLNADGFVNGADFALFRINFGGSI